MSAYPHRDERLIALKCEGLLAHRAGVPAGANPFPANTATCAAWARGWMSFDAKPAFRASQIKEGDEITAADIPY